VSVETLRERQVDRVITIRRGKRPTTIVQDLRAYRDLLYFLIRRDIKARYTQTILGVGWAVLQPLLTMVVFSIFFGRIADVPSSGLPYPVFSLAAVVPWTYFSNSVGYAANSLVSNQQVLSKVYFPRLLIPLAPIGGALLDLGIALLILLCVMAGFGFFPTFPHVLLLPFLLMLLLLAAIGVGIWLAALAIQFRDVRYTTPFLLQLWLFLTPIIYPLSAIPDAARFVYSLNPMTGVIDGFRVALLDTGPVQWQSLSLSLVVSLALLISGARYFGRIERVFADIA
jgi:homopolymeric O-antigen transport system permease protein